MVKIEAIVRPFLLDKIREALTQAGARGMTVSEVRGAGRERSPLEHYRGAEYEAAFQQRVRIEVVVRDDDVDLLVERLRDVAWTGRVGDGRILLLPVLEAIRIRTGDRGDWAVS